MQKKKFGNFYIFTKKQTDFQVIFQLFTARVRSLPPGQPAVFNNLRKTTQNDTNLHKSTQNYSNYFKKILSNQSIIFITLNLMAESIFIISSPSAGLIVLCWVINIFLKFQRSFPFTVNTQ